MTQTILDRLRETGIPFAANDNISEVLRPGDLESIEAVVELAVKQVLHALVIDYTCDHNTRDTARRVAKMLVREVYRGRYEPCPDVTDFPNVKGLDELYTVGPITVRSACSHHMVPILGKAWIGVIPGERLIGLSKFARLTEWVMARPQIQEEAAVQLADLLEMLVAPRALAVVIKAEHLCMSWRGVRDGDACMTTSVMRGLFREQLAARQEFLSMIGQAP